LDEGVTLARRIDRPFLEFSGLVHQAGIELFRSFTRGAEHRRQRLGLAERQGWTDDPVACYAYSILADVPAWQGRPEEAETWWRRVERTIRPEAEPVAAAGGSHLPRRIALARGPGN